MPVVPGLRSPYAKVGRLVYFGRMLDKIRLDDAGRLPPEYAANLGGTANPASFDGRCCRFLGVSYADLVARTRLGHGDEEILLWAHQQGTRRTDEECEMWNMFMLKRGWRDASSPRLRERTEEFGVAQHPISTWFDLLEFDEGRDPTATRAWELRQTLVIVIMGVSGSGKTTIGQALATAVGWPFRDADDFHPPANIAKMRAGLPLDDADRAPWLAAIHAYIEDCLATGRNAVITCSALKEQYRATILTDPTAIKLVYLDGDYALIEKRMSERPGHFMKPEMLKSQFEALEPPKRALRIDIAQPPEVIVQTIRKAYHL